MMYTVRNLVWGQVNLEQEYSNFMHHLMQWKKFSKYVWLTVVLDTIAIVTSPLRFDLLMRSFPSRQLHKQGHIFFAFTACGKQESKHLKSAKTPP